MKKQSRKLNLNRETLAPLQCDDLANVNGGLLTPPPTRTTTRTTTVTTTEPTITVFTFHACR
jgi:hypothetical protein